MVINKTNNGSGKQGEMSSNAILNTGSHTSSNPRAAMQYSILVVTPPPIQEVEFCEVGELGERKELMVSHSMWRRRDPFWLFGAIFGECVTSKVGWELHKLHIANEIEKFHEKIIFESVSSHLEEKKQLSKFLRALCATNWQEEMSCANSLRIVTMEKKVRLLQMHFSSGKRRNILALNSSVMFDYLYLHCNVDIPFCIESIWSRMHLKSTKFEFHDFLMSPILKYNWYF